MNDDWLLALAAGVADGDDSVWEAELAAARPVDLPVLRALRTIGRLVAAHEVATRWAEESGDEREAATAPAPSRLDLDAGHRWGDLEILQPIGAGASASVYLALDTVLEREVALKLIPVPPELPARAISQLLSEARLLAKIRHPNVAVVYGATEADGHVGIWMELIRGQTLRDLVERNGPLSWMETLVVGIDVARAIRSVHQQRILHRDIKANNVLREDGGRIVLVDFGIGVDLQEAATEATGTAGTPLYLAPEVLDGSPPSVQADVYSLGVLLYYLATGRYPVEADSVDELRLAHRLGERRSLREHRSDLDEHFVDAVERTLDADPERRYADVHQMERALSTALTAGTAPRAHDGAAPRPGRWRLPARLTRWVPMAGTVLGLAAVVGLVALLRWLVIAPGPGAEPRRVSFSFAAPPGSSLTDGARNVPMLAPDGRGVLYSATDADGEQRIWLRPLDAFEARPYKGSEGALYPFFGPDGDSVGFFADRQLKVIRGPGAPPLAVAPASYEPRGASWGPSGRILFSPHRRSGLQLVDLATRQVREVTAPAEERSEIGHGWPQLLPGEEHFLYFVDSDDDDVRGIYVGGFDGEPGRRLLAGDASALFASEHLLFVRDGDLLAQPFDLRRLRLAGVEQLVVEGIAVTTENQMAVSVTGDDLCFVPAGLRNESRLVWRGEEGRLLDTVAAGRHLRNPVLSPDGRYVAVESHDERPTGLRIFDLVRGREFPIGEDGRSNQFPVWSPDSKELLFASDRNGRYDLYRQRVDDVARPRLVYASGADKMPTDWSPDGDWIAFIEYAPQRDYDVFLLPARGGAAPRPLVASTFDEAGGRFSPSGDHIAYLSNESGAFEVYVQSLGESSRCQVSTGGGSDPFWGFDGRTLHYLSADGRLLHAVVSPGEPCAVGEAKALFATQVNRPGSSRNHYAVARDGRVLVNEPVATEVNREFRLILGWSHGLR